MKAVVIIDIDEEIAGNFIEEYSENHQDESELTIEDYIKLELQWAESSGIYTAKVITPEDCKNRNEFIGKVSLDLMAFDMD